MMNSEKVAEEIQNFARYGNVGEVSRIINRVMNEGIGMTMYDPADGIDKVVIMTLDVLVLRDEWGRKYEDHEIPQFLKFQLEGGSEVRTELTSRTTQAFLNQLLKALDAQEEQAAQPAPISPVIHDEHAEITRLRWIKLLVRWLKYAEAAKTPRAKLNRIRQIAEYRAQAKEEGFEFSDQELASASE